MSKLYEIIIQTIDEKLGGEIVAIDFRNQSSFFDTFVIASVLNTRMAKSIIDEIEKKVHNEGMLVRMIEGNPQSSWQIIDCYEVVVHLFVTEERQQYQLEKCWNDLPRLEVNV